MSEAWSLERDGIRCQGKGARALLDQPMTAFFASRQCPGEAIRAALDWALQQARRRRVVISGFHSPLERSVLKLLLEARSPAVIVLARPLLRAKLPAQWLTAADLGDLAVIGLESDRGRLIEELAAQRNELAARFADEVVVAHASDGGSLAEQVRCWRDAGRHVAYILTD